MAIPDDLVELVRSSARIEDIAAQRMKIGPVKRGVALCLCPFHDDKTPSLRLNTRENRYKCWSCGAAGDPVQFVMDYDHVTFPEALRKIASESGIDLDAAIRSRAPELSEADKAERLAKRNMYKAVGEAHAAYREALVASPEAMAYVSGTRQLSPEAIEAFQIGYAPDDFGFISRKTLRADWLRDAALDAGLCQKSDNGHQYDLLRGRITYPFMNARGEAIAFAARNFGATDGKGPKYLNTAESPLFSKSKSVFGLQQSKALAKELGFWIVTEGQHDVIASWQNGFPAAGGSTNHLSADQARQLFRYADELILVMDVDGAGQRGTLRSLKDIAPLLLDGRMASVISLPHGDDLDAFLGASGKDGFQALLAQRLSFGDYVCAAAIAAAAELKGPERMAVVVGELRSWAQTIADPSLLTGIVQKVADQLDVPFERLDDLVSAVKKDAVEELERLIRDEPVMALIYAGAMDSSAQSRIANAANLQALGGARHVVTTLLERLSDQRSCKPAALTEPLHAHLAQLRPFGAVVGTGSSMLVEIAMQAIPKAIDEYRACSVTEVSDPAVRDCSAIG